MEKIDKAIEILQAFKEGKTIEVWQPCIWKEFIGDEEILIRTIADTYSKDYLRVKPQPTYRPYANAEEFLKASKEHGPYTKCPDDEYIIVDRVNDGQIEWARRFHTPENLCEHHQSLIYKSFEDLLKENYTWQDGTPCGILEQ